MTLTDAEHRVQLRRAVIAATIGTTIEWYDFFLYGVITGLVFGKMFFPGSDPWVGTLNAFAIYAGGFVARPIGAAIFGHYGDRLGRKSALIATLMLMGLATFAIAFVPGYAQIGVWGAVILSLLRVVQGIGVGGEWGRLGAAGDGVGAPQQASRLHRVLAAAGRADWAVPGQSRRARC